MELTLPFKIANSLVDILSPTYPFEVPQLIIIDNVTSTTVTLNNFILLGLSNPKKILKEKASLPDGREYLVEEQI